MSIKKNIAQQSLVRVVAGNARTPEGYFSFKENPFLKKIVESFIHHYDMHKDNYTVRAFEHPIIDRSPNPIYDMHMYWAKKPHGAIEKYIEHFTEEGDIVLDPMCGSGGAGSVALRLRRKAILIDISPAATFISKHLVTIVNINELRDAFKQLYDQIEGEIEWLYETKCDRCGGKALTAYVVHSQMYRCVKCFNKVALYDCDDERLCPHCKEKVTSRQERLGYVPVECAYLCLNDCRPQRDRRKHNDPNPKKRKFFEQYDLAKLKEIESKKIPYWYPTDPFPTEWISWRPNLGEAKDVSGFFTKRNLWAAALIVHFLKEIKRKEYSSWLMFAFTATLLNISKKAQHLEEGGGYIPGNYTFPPMIKERNALNSYRSLAKKVLDGVQYLDEHLKTQDVVISTQSALDLSAIPSSSIDYIFTDPPYSNKVPFGEFNFLWEVWLREGISWKGEEVIVNEKIGKDYGTWKEMMIRIILECYRVLKPGRWMSVCYHDSAEGSWGLLQDAFNEVGFIPDKIDRVLSIERDLKSFKQRTTKNVQMRDLVVNFRKPKLGEVRGDVSITGTEDNKTFNGKVHSIILDYLEGHPGATRDRIYDEVVSHMVRAGQMEAHDFDGLLRQVAEEVKEPVKKTFFENEDPNLFGTHEVSRWYLKETQFAEVDAAESAKEDGAADKMELFMTKKLKEQPWLDGVHYSDIFEHYIYSVKDKPRRQLAEWLLDYFYKTDAGTYRLPQSEDEKHLKTEGRAKGTQRRIKHFIAYLQQGVAIPSSEQPNDATLAEWLRYCKRSGLYEHGKLLYEKGGLTLDNISEEAMVNAEEDYQVCVRMLVRGTSGSENSIKARKKKK